MRTEPTERSPALLDPLAGRRILVGISGSIAAVKLPLVVSALVQRGAEVRCVLTPSAEQLVSAVALASLSRHRCYLDADQWSHTAPRPLHVELAEWAEFFRAKVNPKQLAIYDVYARAQIPAAIQLLSREYPAGLIRVGLQPGDWADVLIEDAGDYDLWGRHLVHQG